MSRFFCITAVSFFAATLGHGDTLDLTVPPGSMTGIGGWENGGSWLINGQAPMSVATLTTPFYTLAGDGFVSGTLVHRYSFEMRGDGGQLQYRVGLGAWNTISRDLITGTTYDDKLDLGVGSAIRDQYAFTGESTYYSGANVTSSFVLGTGPGPFQSGTADSFAAGDQIQFRLLAAWDAGGLWQTPNWHLASLTLNFPLAPPPTHVPDTGTTAALLVGALAVMGLLRRRFAR